MGRRGQSPFQVTLTASERKLLKLWVRTPTAPYRQVLRAKVVLLAAAGDSNAHIAARLQITGNTVRKWRRRFSQQGLVGLRDRPRSGRPRRFPYVVQRKVLTPNDFLDLTEVKQRLLGFQRRYQQAAVPFDWRFTRADLEQLLHRLDDHKQLRTAA